MYFYAHMKGFDCYSDGELALIVRAFQHDDSPGQTLEMLSGIVTEDRRLIAASNWVAVGTQANLLILKGLTDTESNLLPVVKPLSERQNALNFCVVAGSTVAVSILEGTTVLDTV